MSIFHKPNATGLTPWLCATTVPLFAFSCVSLSAQQPPWEHRIYHKIDTAPGQFPRFLSPIGRTCVIERKIRTEQFEALYLCVAGRGCDDAGAAHLCELKGKKRDPARSLRQHRLTRLHVPKLNDGAPGR
jgi:hypothetical protein